MTEVTLEMTGVPSQKTKGKLIRIDGDEIILEGFSIAEVHYSLKDGRCLLNAWDFWRISKEDLRRIEEEME